jgi:hypothetical protein
MKRFPAKRVVPVACGESIVSGVSGGVEMKRTYSKPDRLYALSTKTFGNGRAKFRGCAEWL